MTTRYGVLADLEHDECAIVAGRRNRAHLHLIADDDTHTWVPVTTGSIVRVGRGRKVAKGTTGRIVWLGESNGYMPGTTETRVGIVIDGVEKPVYLNADYIEWVADPAPMTATCARCGATFTDAGTVSAFDQRRAHDGEAHPRPAGIRVDLRDGTYFNAAGAAVWATCPVHGLVAPAVVAWDGWTRNDAGAWVLTPQTIARSERVALPREDGSASTVDVDRTMCGTCGAPSVLRVIKLRHISPDAAAKAYARAIARADKRDAELITCGGACLTGKVSCDCFCGGQCHGAALGGLGRALMMESISRMIADAKARGDVVAEGEWRARMTREQYPCPGHPRGFVRRFYGVD